MAARRSCSATPAGAADGDGRSRLRQVEDRLRRVERQLAAQRAEFEAHRDTVREWLWDLPQHGGVGEAATSPRDKARGRGAAPLSPVWESGPPEATARSGEEAWTLARTVYCRQLQHEALCERRARVLHAAIGEFGRPPPLPSADQASAGSPSGALLAALAACEDRVVLDEVAEAAAAEVRAAATDVFAEAADELFARVTAAAQEAREETTAEIVAAAAAERASIVGEARREAAEAQATAGTLARELRAEVAKLEASSVEALTVEASAASERLSAQVSDQMRDLRDMQTTRFKSAAGAAEELRSSLAALRAQRAEAATATMAGTSASRRSSSCGGSLFGATVAAGTSATAFGADVLSPRSSLESTRRRLMSWGASPRGGAAADVEEPPSPRPQLGPLAELQAGLRGERARQMLQAPSSARGSLDGGSTWWRGERRSRGIMPERSAANAVAREMQRELAALRDELEQRLDEEQTASELVRDLFERSEEELRDQLRREVSEFRGELAAVEATTAKAISELHGEVVAEAQAEAAAQLRAASPPPPPESSSYGRSQVHEELRRTQMELVEVKRAELMEEQRRQLQAAAAASEVQARAHDEALEMHRRIVHDELAGLAEAQAALEDQHRSLELRLSRHAGLTNSPAREDSMEAVCNEAEVPKPDFVNLRLQLRRQWLTDIADFVNAERRGSPGSLEATQHTVTSEVSGAASSSMPTAASLRDEAMRRHRAQAGQSASVPTTPRALYRSSSPMVGRNDGGSHLVRVQGDRVMTVEDASAGASYSYRGPQAATSVAAASVAVTLSPSATSLAGTIGATPEAIRAGSLSRPAAGTRNPRRPPPLCVWSRTVEMPTASSARHPLSAR